MSTMNHARASFAGRVSQDPTRRVFASGDSVANLSLAVNRRWEDPQNKGTYKEAVSFFDFVIKGDLADKVMDEIKKGDYVNVTECEPRMRTWEEDDGTKRSKIDFHLSPFSSIGKVIFTTAAERAANQQAAALPAGVTPEMLAAAMALVQGAGAAAAAPAETRPAPSVEVTAEEPF